MTANCFSGGGRIDETRGGKEPFEKLQDERRKTSDHFKD